MKIMFFIFCVFFMVFVKSDEKTEVFKLASLLYDIDELNTDDNIKNILAGLKNINNDLIGNGNKNLVDKIDKELNRIKNLDKPSRENVFRKITFRFNKFNELHTIDHDGKNFNKSNLLQIELNDLKLALGEDSYWVFNYRVNLIASKIVRNETEGVLNEIKSLENDLENKKIKSSILAPPAICLYCLYYEKLGDWNKCEKYAKEALNIYPDRFNENFLSGPISFLLKSSFMLGKFEYIEFYKNLLTSDFMFSVKGRNLTMLRINETLGKYYLKKGKIIDAISHQEIALFHISKMAPKDSDQVKAVATDLRNMLKQNNEIQAMRNLEERYNLKPLP